MTRSQLIRTGSSIINPSLYHFLFLFNRSERKPNFFDVESYPSYKRDLSSFILSIGKASLQWTLAQKPRHIHFPMSKTLIAMYCTSLRRWKQNALDSYTCCWFSFGSLNFLLEVKLYSVIGEQTVHRMEGLDLQKSESLYYKWWFVKLIIYYYFDQVFLNPTMNVALMKVGS